MVAVRSGRYCKARCPVPQVRARSLGANLGVVSTFEDFAAIPARCSFGLWRGLRRFQESRQSHFVTFSCYQRRPCFADAALFDLFVQCLEDMRVRFDLCVYGYVVMPEHVHLLLSEPGAFAQVGDSHCPTHLSQVSAQETGANPPTSSGQALGHQSFHHSLADALHYLKLSFAKRALRIRPTGSLGSFWQKRYYDRNVRDYSEFTVKLRYLHRNPVRRGLVRTLEEWKWSSYRHYALREIGVVEIESEWTARDRELKARGGMERVFLRPE